MSYMNLALAVCLDALDRMAWISLRNEGSVSQYGALVTNFRAVTARYLPGKVQAIKQQRPFFEHKTRRTWLPNVQTKRIFSDALNQSGKLKVTMRALKNIKKHGGLDNYFTKGMKPSELSTQLRRNAAMRQRTRRDTDAATCQCSATKIPGVPQGAEEDGWEGETCRDHRGAEGCPQSGQAQ
ncbi:hypothetical protein DFS33DRAFT_780132 [Desarmillaria ectypa]|nr:hypothetical protein DFS33DRAFT_780132 [Desarmillaria ectypa]